MTQYNNIQSKTKYNLSLALLLGVMAISCQKQKDETPQNQVKLVDVSLNIGFSEETDGYELAQTTRGDIDEDAAFDFELVPTPKTRANTNTPDQLYNLEIRQYDANGTYLNGTHFGSTTKKIGESLTISLNSATNCQLVIVAWGNNVNTSTTLLGAKSLKDAMEVAYPAASVQSIPTTDAAPMNGMPYVLHLKNINVSSGAIQSGTSEVDARIRLKRMASLLSINWTYNVSGYKLNQVLLQSIPLNFRVVPSPDANDGTYPTLIDQFTTIQLTASEIAKGSYSRWVPANVRGNMATANSITNRYKATAPQGSVFANFVATNENDIKKKLDYRIYIGGANVTNFDVLPNTNYTYQVNFSHTGIPLNDKRVTYIDPIPASQNNNNFVPTSNCFMVVPGGSFNFDPTKMRIKGSDIDNPYLTGSGKWGDVKSVKLIWQTKENGDVGDPTMGIVNTNTDHSNIVEYNPTSKRIYCRVAANTAGGSGEIAAYDNVGNILWSWHVWVTDYSPDHMGDYTIDEPNKRKQKYTFGGANTLPIMDRNLGAKAGYTITPPNELEKSKTNGFHYQWGRKDPFPSSYTEKQISSITIQTTAPTVGMLNLYKPDGISFFPRIVMDNHTTLKEAYRNPANVYIADGKMIVAGAAKIWCNEIVSATNPKYSIFWGMGTDKGIHDPCPAGWRIPSKNVYKRLFTSLPTDDTANNIQAWPLNITNNLTAISDGGVVVRFEGENSGRTTYIRLNGYQQTATQFNYVGKMVNLWCRDTNSDWGATKEGAHSYTFCVNYSPGGLLSSTCAHVKASWDQADAHPVRCIQEE